ncbi:MAG: hypothetical protein OXC28_07070 [Defluviicoccus sp.]|nr:hypothetical protein [Defluviicoccus sp.]
MSTQPTPKAPRLRLFPSAEEAVAAAGRSAAGDDLETIPFGAGLYLRKPGRPGVEPRFLCADGRWRKYDSVPDLPGSAAAQP